MVRGLQRVSSQALGAASFWEGAFPFPEGLLPQVMEPPRTYRFYVLRLRLVDNAGQPVWRASLQEPGSEWEVQFGSLGEMCAYLAGEIGVENHEKRDETQQAE